jgi:plasmid stability protein
MATLILRHVDDAIVQALKARADRNGLTAEAEHINILRSTLLRPTKKSFANVLLSIPGLGRDSDFEPVQDKGAPDVFN